jgi:hypothetical protein
LHTKPGAGWATEGAAPGEAFENRRSVA